MIESVCGPSDYTWKHVFFLGITSTDSTDGFKVLGLKSYKKLQISITNIYLDSGIYDSPIGLVHAICARDAVVIPIHRPLPAMCEAELLFLHQQIAYHKISEASGI